MFCTDDKHPNDLLEKGHIDYIVKKSHLSGRGPNHGREGRRAHRRPVLPAE